MAVSYVHMLQSTRVFNKGNLRLTSHSHKRRRNPCLAFASIQRKERDIAIDPKVESLLGCVRWNNKGLAVAIAQNVDTGAILKQGYADRDALAATISSRKATFYTKGDTSNNLFNVHDVFLDSDCDFIIYLGKPDRPTSHTRSCSYTSVFDLLKGPEEASGNKVPLTTLFALESKISRRKELEAGENGNSSCTKRLLREDRLLCSKIRHEAHELCKSLEYNYDRLHSASKMADLLYHAMVLLAQKDVKIEEHVLDIVRRRFSVNLIEEKKKCAI